jgi:hypothetical protein
MYAMHARRNAKGGKLGFFQQTTIIDKLVHKRKYDRHNIIHKIQTT